MTGGLAALIVCVLGGRQATAEEIATGIAELQALPPEQLRPLGPKIVRVAEELGAAGLPLLRAVLASPSLFPPTYVRAMHALQRLAPRDVVDLTIAHAGHLPPELVATHAAGHVDEVADAFGEQWERSAETRAALRTPALVADPAFVDRALRVLHEDPVHACLVLGWNGSPQALEELVQLVERSEDLRDAITNAALRGLAASMPWSPFDLAAARRFLRQTRLAPVLVRLLRRVHLPSHPVHAAWEEPLVFACLGLRQEIRALAPDDPHIEAALERYRFPLSYERPFERPEPVDD